MALVVPDEEVFWDNVRKAVNHVETTHSLRYDIGVGNRAATIYWYYSESALEDGSDDGYVRVEIDSRDPEQPALLVP
jgi:hypothetical protein